MKSLVAASFPERSVHAGFIVGIILLVLGVLAYVVVNAAIWFAVILFIAGIVAIIWGAVKVKRAW